MPDMGDVVTGKVAPFYGVADMARDVVGVLDALGVDRADVAGISLGGMVAQHLAIDHGERRSVTSVMSSSSTGPAEWNTRGACGAHGAPEDPDDREA